MNSELCRQALSKVGDPNFLVNIVSRRVRQLSTSGAPGSRPLLTDTTGMGLADIALAEIVQEKLGWQIPEQPQAAEPAPKKRKKH